MYVAVFHSPTRTQCGLEQPGRLVEGRTDRTGPQQALPVLVRRRRRFDERQPARPSLPVQGIVVCSVKNPCYRITYYRSVDMLSLYRHCLIVDDVFYSGCMRGRQSCA